jgi:hypothetical protein
LTPLLDPPKNPYIRGDTGGGTPHRGMGGGGYPYTLPHNIFLSVRDHLYPYLERY